jgi:adenylate kinase family enzyme
MNQKERIKQLNSLRVTKTPYKMDDIIYKGEKKLLPVFEIPLEFLVYNKYNGRILSMVKSYEQQFHSLIVENKADKKTIEKFLWESKIARNKITMEDLKEYGQKKIGIVTRDGIIIDGNRRASILNRIAQEKSESKYFKAIILDDTLDDNPKEIMQLETKYQMGEDDKLDYNPIEKYLKCKDLTDIGFGTVEIANMMGEKEPRINEWLDIMHLMDNYLDDLGYSGIYTRLEKLEGQFVDLSRYLKRYDNGSSYADWSYKKSDISDLKAICFDYMRARYEGKEFRAIAALSKKDSFFCKQKVWEKFRDNHFKTIDPINQKEYSIDELREKEPQENLSKILKVRDEEWKSNASATLTGNLEKARRRLQDFNEENAPLILLRRAKDTLNSINTDVEPFYNDSTVLSLIKEISLLTRDYEKIIKSSQK